MDKNCETVSKNITNHVSRIKGQLSGIDKMVSEGRNSLEIVNQISAVRASLSKLAVELLKEESKECLNKKNKDEQMKNFEDIVVNFFKIN